MERAGPNSTSNSALVLNTPKLTCLIASYLKASDTVHLSQMCRPLFENLLPTIWQDVNGSENLLCLIKSSLFHPSRKPGLRGLYDDDEYDDEPSNPPQQMILEAHRGCDQFERFDLYAPFVQSLNVYRDNHEFFTVSGWPVPTSRAVDRPLLPNLKVLSIVSTDERVRIPDIPMWIKTFGADTVVDVSTSIHEYFWPDNIWAMTYACSSETLESLVKRCANVRKLAICPHQICDNSLPYSPYRPPAERSPKLWFDYLTELPSLRHLEVTNGWLTYPCLMALSQLTSLESLDLHLGDFQGFGIPRDINEEMSDDAFPSLRKLLLSRVSCYRISKFRTLPKLFRNITEFEAHLASKDGGFSTSGSSFILGIVPYLVHAPNLKTLRAIGDLYDTGPYRINSPKSLDIMAQLPLESVLLRTISLGKGRLAFNLGVIWPNVTELVMPHQYASLQELSYFAAIPNLRRLALRLHLTTTYDPDNIPAFNHAPLRTLESSEGGKLAKTLKVMKHNARVLRLLWPQMHEVNWYGEVDFTSFLYGGMHRMVSVHSIFNRILDQTAPTSSTKGTTGQRSLDVDRSSSSVEEDVISMIISSMEKDEERRR